MAKSKTAKLHKKGKRSGKVAKAKAARAAAKEELTKAAAIGLDEAVAAEKKYKRAVKKVHDLKVWAAERKAARKKR